ncbi:tubulin binding cofactor A-domain-containing protein [Amylocystis lapponica]|nr:tubulin binding cofactor A-domain-containing protein [Amylocystis lapponica]
MSDTAALRRQLKIKTGVTKRLAKEHKSYQKEEEDQKRKLDKFVADRAEDWDIGNATRMLEESRKMITDTANRLGGAVQELRELMVAAEQDPALHADEALINAQEVFEEVSM